MMMQSSIERMAEESAMREAEVQRLVAQGIPRSEARNMVLSRGYQVDAGRASRNSGFGGPAHRPMVSRGGGVGGVNPQSVMQGLSVLAALLGQETKRQKSTDAGEGETKKAAPRKMAGTSGTAAAMAAMPQYIPVPQGKPLAEAGMAAGAQLVSGLMGGDDGREQVEKDALRQGRQQSMFGGIGDLARKLERRNQEFRQAWLAMSMR
jgi:hypothetical protein